MSAGKAMSNVEPSKECSAGQIMSDVGPSKECSAEQTVPDVGPSKYVSPPAEGDGASAQSGLAGSVDQGPIAGPGSALPKAGPGCVPLESASEQVKDGAGPGRADDGPTTARGCGAPSDCVTGDSDGAPLSSRDASPQEEFEKQKAAEDRARTEAEDEGAALVPGGEEGEQALANKEAEACWTEKEDQQLEEDCHFTVIDIGNAAPHVDRLEKDVQQSSYVKQISAAVRTLSDSEDGDGPVAVPLEETNGDANGSPSERRDRTATHTDVDGSAARTNGNAPDGGDSTDTISVIAEKTTDSTAAQAVMYGVVSPIYKEPSAAGGRGLRKLAARPGSGLTASGDPAGGAASSPASSALLSSRQSQCIVCRRMKAIKYMMMANGSSSGNVICSDECLEKCVSDVKSGRMNIMNGEAAVTLPAGSPAAPPPSLTVSSVTSLSASTAAGSPAPVSAAPTAPPPATAAASRGRTTCQNADCGRVIPSTTAGRQMRTVWETLVFCSPTCAVQHQKKDGSACVFCKLELPEMIMGKYCVRFGSDVRQFCSNLCLDGFKKRLKVCSYCQRDITRFQGSFLAPVGNAGAHQFKEFCSQTCLTRYKSTHSELAKGQTTWSKCSVCLKNTPVEHRVAVKPNEPVKQLCSQICLKAYKFAIKDQGTLETCAVCKALLAVNNMAQFRVWNGSAVAYLCSQSCSNVFVLSNRRIVSCRYCKVKKYNFDMMEITSEKDGLYCSVHCLKNCGKRIGPRRDNRPPSSCAACGASVDPSSFSGTYSGGSDVFCGTKCAQAGASKRQTTSEAADRPANGVPAGPPPAQLPQIQSVVSLADGGGGGQPAQLLPAARDHPALVLMPPAPTSRRNVCVQVQPRGPDQEAARERSETATVGTQTVSDTDELRVLPVPVPMYVPTPMAMYSCPYPIPVPMPLPVPVPLLCGAEDALRLLCGLPAVHLTTSRDPPREWPAAGKWFRTSSSSVGNASPEREPEPEPEPDLEPEPDGSSESGAGPSESPDSDEGGSETPPPRKRRKVEDPAGARLLDLVPLLRAPPAMDSAQGGTQFLGPTEPPTACHRSAVKYTWCVRVFEQFIQQRNSRPLTSSESDPVSSEARGRLVADPLQATPAQLAAGLRAMTCELKRPSGEPYPPDLIHYILLGVQAYLLQHGRPDSLFWDEPYAALTTALEQLLRPVAEQLSLAELDPSSSPLPTHVEEQQLWETRVLGAHSPQSLLTTVLFFVIKHFLLGTLRMHQKLSFTMIEESIALKTRLRESSLKLLDSKNIYKRCKTYEMPANTRNPFRCPVRFIEFYLSRCPESARSAPASAIYLTPAVDSRPDSSTWFSAEPLPLATLQQLLGRLLTVRQLQAALLTGARS